MIKLYEADTIYERYPYYSVRLINHSVKLISELIAYNSIMTDLRWEIKRPITLHLKGEV